MWKVLYKTNRQKKTVTHRDNNKQPIKGSPFRRYNLRKGLIICLSV